jgi:hypothetical protein
MKFGADSNEDLSQNQTRKTASPEIQSPADAVLISFCGRFLKMVGRTGFEPVKAMPVDLQSTPFGHSGTYPLFYSLGSAPLTTAR